jgi:hypothetical protein
MKAVTLAGAGTAGSVGDDIVIVGSFVLAGRPLP